MINCGGSLDIVDSFSLSDKDDLMVYVLDSHRPVNLANIYDEQLVLIFELDDIKYPPQDELEVDSAERVSC